MSTNFLQEGFILNGGRHQYRIVRVLGHGGFGITYLAQTRVAVGNISITAKFAIKEHFLKADCERDSTTSRVQCSGPAQERVETSRKDFLAEARRLHNVGVTHTNIVKVNEVFEANNTAYYVMEYLDGESLSDYVKRKGALTEAEALAIMKPIASAVAGLHANRMTHLDIKPANIMLVTDEDGRLRPVLIDFGLSKHYDDSGEPTSTINIQGFSDGYAPIEQYMGITTFSPRSDVYALGATLYFCLTGRKPGKPDELAKGELAASLPPSVSNATRSIVEQATRLIKSERAEDVAALFGLDARNETVNEVTEILTDPEDEATRIVDDSTQIVKSRPVEPEPEIPVVHDVKPPQPKPAPPTVAPAAPATKKSPKKLLIIIGAVILLAVVGVIVALTLTGGADKAETNDAGAEAPAENMSSTATKERNEKAVANLKLGEETARKAAETYGFKLTPSGIAYDIQNGKELVPPRDLSNMVVTIDYTIKKLNGDVLDSNKDAQMSTDEFLPGFKEALSMLNVGSNGYFYIPGDLAYGEKGIPEAGIEPMEMIVLQVTLKGINPQ